MTENRIKSVVLYCASSPHIDKSYIEAAKELANILVKNDITCITGAGKTGLMGALNDTIIENNGIIKGVIPQFMFDAGWSHPNLSELIITEDIHERKKQMADFSDAAIALPGGLGTLEELAEILTWKQLNLYNKPIIILNTNGYYDSLLAFLNKMVDEKFMHTDCKKMWRVISSPKEIINALTEESCKQISKIPKYNEKEL